MKPTACISLDLDNQWSYMKSHGEPGWESFPSYLEVAVPRILEFLGGRGLKITFFIVGQDAALTGCQQGIASIAHQGHEIANHSFNHEPWLHLYSEDQLEEEFARSEAQIQDVTGINPRGFRGPGFSLSSGTLRTLIRRGYLYDATICPNLLNPLARAYFLSTSRLSQEEKRRRRALFGSLRDATRPLKPFWWEVGHLRFLEIPVTTIPLLRIPMHMSYIVYLSRFSRSLAMSYFRFALQVCSFTRTPPSMLLHPLDFLGCDDVKGLGFFPGMDMQSSLKLEIVSRALHLFQSAYEPIPIRSYAEELSETAPSRLSSLAIEA